MSSTAVKACLITNPRSGRGPIDLTDALAVLRAQGWDVRVREKRRGGEATKLAQAAADAGCTIVAACAGDGTVSEIVDGLVGTDVAVGVLPGGTANLWAHELGVSSKLRVAALQLVGAERRRVDVGHVSVNGRHGQHFLLMAGLGLDGAIISRLSKPLKRRLGKLAVGVAALQTLPGYRATQVYAEMDGIPWHGKISQLIVGNTRLYGGFTRVTGNAFIDDGLLDICLFRAAGPTAAGRQVASLLFRRRPSTDSAELYRGASLTLEAPSVLPLQIDGGAVRLKKVKRKAGVVTYEFTTVASGITMLIPRAYNGALFRHDALSFSYFQPGDVVQYKGKKNGGHSTVQARRLME
ncbi:MAG: diacylglycerol/lipid kinase family protein [Chloroflexota bacterium]